MSDSVLEEFAGGFTVDELCTRTGCTVEALFEFCFSDGKVSASSSSPTRAPTNRGRKATEGVNTRTREGREAFDSMLVDLLQGVKSGMSARDIAEETDASLPQIRSAVARLVSKRKVRFEGKTAARRYWAR